MHTYSAKAQEAIEAAGYKVAFFGQKTYNGVALLSRSEATDVVKNIPGFEDDRARVIAGTVDGVRVIGAYFPNGQARPHLGHVATRVGGPCGVLHSRRANAAVGR